MKMIIVIALALVAITAASPVGEVPVFQVLRSEFNQKPEGSYNFGYETENGIIRNENGEVKEVIDEEKKPHTVVVVRGTYAYTNPEGKLETVEYFADENGYHAEGDSIPKLVARR